MQILQTSSSKAEETADAADSENSSELININTAPASELVKLKGIGEVKAAAIVEYRRINGNFKTVQDIMNVSGIGEKTFEKNPRSDNGINLSRPNRESLKVEHQPTNSSFPKTKTASFTPARQFISSPKAEPQLQLLSASILMISII